MDLVFDLSTSTTDSLNDYMPTDIGAWMDSIARVAERYDGDGYKDMPGLTRPVHYYHLIEEDTFWKGTVDEYLLLMSLTRAAIRSADPNGKLVTMGFSSDTAWEAGHNAGFIRLPPTWTESEDRPKYVNYVTRVTRVLNEGSYDVVDVHSYEKSPILQGKMAWLRSLMPDPSKPIWCMEGGYPSETRADGYSDTLQAEGVLLMYGEALTNNIGRYAMPLFPTSPGSWDDVEQSTNVALTRWTVWPLWATKPAYETYRLLTLKLTGWTSATDMSIRDGATDMDDLFDFRFQTPHGQVDIVGCPSGNRTLTLSTSYRYLLVTRIITRAGQIADNAQTFSVPVVGGTASVTAGPEPFFIEYTNAGLFSEIYPGTGQDGQPGTDPQELSLRMAPLPARENVQITWSASAASPPASIVIADVMGRTVRSFTLSDADASVGTLVWDLRDRHGDRVPAGLYLARITDRSGKQTVRRLPVAR
jgi:hypothetical protein